MSEQACNLGSDQQITALAFLVFFSYKEKFANGGYHSTLAGRPRSISACERYKDASAARGDHYDVKPREYTLCAITTVVNVHTRVSDLYSNPYNQASEQLRLTVENVKERQENEIINNDEYGLLKNVPPGRRIKMRKGSPTPDDLDELLSKTPPPIQALLPIRSRRRFPQRRRFISIETRTSDLNLSGAPQKRSE